jgi:hypothetical protein
MENRFVCKNENSDFSLMSQPFHSKQIALKLAYQDLSET